MQSISVNIVAVIDAALRSYSESKEQYDAQISKASEFEYSVRDSFEDAGNKVPSFLSHSAVFVDCTHLQNDFKEML